MNISEERTVQQQNENGTLSINIPKFIVKILKIKKGDRLVFNYRNNKINIERSKNE